jgi:hypothetical protein
MGNKKKIKVNNGKRNINNLPKKSVKIVEAPIYMLSEIINIDTVKEIGDSNEMRSLVEIFATTALDLYNHNEYELANKHAIIALDLYNKLVSNHQSRPSEIKYFIFANNVIKWCKSSEA